MKVSAAFLLGSLCGPATVFATTCDLFAGCDPAFPDHQAWCRTGSQPGGTKLSMCWPADRIETMISRGRGYCGCCTMEDEPFDRPAHCCDCDDGDPCTIDTCDENFQCVNTPVECGEDEVCDSFSGECEDVQNLVPCVAVIDEWNNIFYNSEWQTFRNDYPKRPFCLLVPNFPGTSVDNLPQFFDNDDLSPDGVDRTLVVVVNRDDRNPAGAPSDWFSDCQLDQLPNSANVPFIGLFVDESGSMTKTTVQASYDKFLLDVAGAGFAIATVTDPSERWIDPFLTTLAP